MDIVDKFIDTELVYCDYWFRKDRPEVAARKCLESVLFLHYVSNTYSGYTGWRASINLESLLRLMIDNYIFDDFVKHMLNQVLDGDVVYDETYSEWFRRSMLETDNMCMRLIYGCLLKIFVPYKPDISIILNRTILLSDLGMLMTRAKSKKIICNPDSEICNNQYRADKWLTARLKRLKDLDSYSQLYIMAIMCDIVVLSYVQRTSRFKYLFPFFKQLCIKDFYITLTQ